MKYTIAKQEGTYILMADGNPCICPFRNPFPQQSQLGGIQLISFQCNSQCALFDFQQEDHTPMGADLPGKELTLNCGSGRNFFPIEIEEPKAGKELKIIK